MAKLNALAIAKLKPGPKRIEIGDDTAGLKLIIQTSGSMTWAYRFRFGVPKKPAKLTLGPYPGLGIAEARELAVAASKMLREQKGEPTVGKDEDGKLAIVARTAPAAATTVEAVVAQFKERYLDRKTRLSTQKMVKPVLDRLVEVWKGRELTSITRKEIRQVIEDAEKRGPKGAAALKTQMIISKFFNWAVTTDKLDVSPARNLSGDMVKPPPRDRVLSDDEIVRLWRALDRVQPWLAVFVKVLLLSAQRRSEVSGLRWEELGDEGWMLPASRSKNRRKHLTQLTPLVLELLGSPPENDTFVFTSDDGVTSRSSFARMKTAIDDAIAADGQEPMPHWTFHDLRRTASSGMSRLDVPPHVRERVLNHTMARLTATYDVHEYKDEKFVALSVWTWLVLDLVAGRPAKSSTKYAQAWEAFTEQQKKAATNVVTFPGRAA